VLSHTRRRSRNDAGDDAGFTLIELLVVASISVVVLAIAGSGLISLSTASTRSTAMIATQQKVTAAETILAKDLRSTNRLTAAAASSLTASVNQASGSPVTVTWTASGGTLTRSAGGRTTTILTGLTNDNVFAYSASDGTSLAGYVSATVLGCATSVTVSLEQQAPSAVTAFQDPVTVALTDRMEALNEDGGGGCP
jgi:prepilin-type N-terminal cleavage/methylation domain-containing protein